MTERRGPEPVSFEVPVEIRSNGGIAIRLPFDPSDAWGPRDRHDVRGTVDGHGVRGRLASIDGEPYLLLGPSWCRDARLADGQLVPVTLGPEGPQLGSMSPDIAAALIAEPDARSFFETLATFYRKGFVDWIEAAKRPETRARRIEETIAALKAGRRER